MARVFTCLALCILLLLLGTGFAGFTRPGGTLDRHVILAVFSLIFACFLQVLTFTYLTVTGKMIGQMVHLAKLDMSIFDDVKRRKRSVSRLLAALFLAVVVAAATGGASWREGIGSRWHLAVAALLLLLFAVVVYRQFGLIVTNARQFDGVVRDYNAIRQRAATHWADPRQGDGALLDIGDP